MEIGTMVDRNVLMNVVLNYPGILNLLFCIWFSGLFVAGFMRIMIWRIFQHHYPRSYSGKDWFELVAVGILWPGLFAVGVGLCIVFVVMFSFEVIRYVMNFNFFIMIRRFLTKELFNDRR